MNWELAVKYLLSIIVILTTGYVTLELVKILHTMVANEITANELTVISIIAGIITTALGTIGGYMLGKSNKE